jgi:cell wall-associated NlpC family hydrolase
LWESDKWAAIVAEWTGVSHDVMDCSASVHKWYDEMGLPYGDDTDDGGFTTANFATCADFYEVFRPQTGDVVLFDGHMGIYDANPPIRGYNIFSSTNHGIRYGEASWFSGTPRYFRYRRL